MLLISKVKSPWGGGLKQDVFVKHNAPDNGQFQRRPRSQGKIF